MIQHRLKLSHSAQELHRPGVAWEPAHRPHTWTWTHIEGNGTGSKPHERHNRKGRLSGENWRTSSLLNFCLSSESIFPQSVGFFFISIISLSLYSLLFLHFDCFLSKLLSNFLFCLLFLCSLNLWLLLFSASFLSPPPEFVLNYWKEPFFPGHAWTKRSTSLQPKHTKAPQVT